MHIQTVVTTQGESSTVNKGYLDVEIKGSCGLKNGEAKGDVSRAKLFP